MLDLVVACCLSVVNSYHIGNSLMFDGMGNSTGSIPKGTFGLEQIARDYGYDYSLALHIDNSQPMYKIWETPDGVGGEVDGFREPYGYWDNALANYHWDNVLFEPYFQNSSTVGLDKQTIGNFINYTRSNPLNAGTVFYVYQVWPQQGWIAGAGSYSNYWLDDTPVTDSTLTRPKQAQYDYLMEWAQETYAPQGIMVRTVPNGEVWHQVSLAIESGEISEIVLSDLYRDQIHGSGPIGRYLAAVTNFATMFQTSSVGLVPPPVQFGSAYPQSLYDKLNAIIWDVVSSDPYTGIADFNDDGYVSQADLALWRSSYGMSAAADADGDGDTDGQDFLVWQRAVESLSAFSAVTVPEPGTILLLSAGMLLICSGRHRG